MTAEKNEKKADWFVRFAWLIHDSKSHVFRKAKNVFITGKDCAKPRNTWQNEISVDHRRSTLLPKRQRQMDFVIASVAANDHAKSAIIAHMRTVLTQVKHCLPTFKNAFVRGSLQDLYGEGTASRIHWFS